MTKATQQDLVGIEIIDRSHNVTITLSLSLD